MRHGLVACLIAAIVLLPGSLPALEAQRAIQVTVSIGPQKYFVEKIGGGMVDVVVMVEPGVDPHVYDPKPQQMAALDKSRIYFAAGVPFEDVWLPRFASANPSMTIVHTEKGIEKLLMAGELTHDHHSSGDKAGEPLHKPGSTKAQKTYDPHLWLSPSNCLIISRNILQGLIDADEPHRKIYEDNYQALATELIRLDLDLISLFSDVKGSREFMVFHPSWGYFADAYRLEQLPVEIEGKEPKAADLKKLIQYAREHGAKAIFVQPQYSTSSAKVVADAIGARLVTADPLAVDWAKNLRDVAQRIRETLN